MNKTKDTFLVRYDKDGNEIERIPVKRTTLVKYVDDEEDIESEHKFPTGFA